ncbi:MAG TPA: (d)CMP kinase [Alphaproteobacteria bacterium]|jgi:cytidylate kinase|nr:(d)CMP kinase [Alphaproteobacteria bacterium]MDP6270499.1 (d)CMP kinase [Alphaproteobacteria bacterium]MDP7426568.1 (d)CMP kinase [Alphaproteobacteria bacterium]HJM50826.1 (d)CMP kinase [Alphaproteobacteria bacterium]
MIIAVDGPAAAGKGTLARRLAAHYDLAYLDTGGLYRATALRLLRAGEAAEPGPAAAAAAAIRPEDLVDPALRHEQTGDLASRVSALPAVRAALLQYQRDFAAEPPTGSGAVLDGRDIGTVVCPDAEHKLFVTASAEERARRRVAELHERGETDVDPARILAELLERDARDSERQASPLEAAADAYLLDTTNLDIDAAFEAAKAHISAAKR